MKINKNLAPAILLIAIALVLSSPPGCSGFKSESERLREEITDVNQENERLKRELNSLKSEKANIHMRLAQLNLQLSALHNEILSLQKGLDSLKTKGRGESGRERKS
jgi:chromosome segregation ATPase